jgi:endonuclease YncB( thermonuclease family)
MPWPFQRPDDPRPTAPTGANPAAAAPPLPPSSPHAASPAKDDPPLLTPTTLALAALLTAAALALRSFHARHLRRIPTAAHITPSMLRRRTLLGRVVAVGDGDNFRIFHTPGGRLAGWGWFPGRRAEGVGSDGKAAPGQTIHVRIAGVDAPEMAHFGRPAQPYGREAMDWLTGYLLGRRVRARLWRKDQYGRVVASVSVRRGWLPPWRRDVALEMLRRGLAAVYEAKSGAEFGGRKEAYVRAEEKARRAGVGMWTEKSVWRRILGGGQSEAVETPMEFKRRMGRADEARKEDASKEKPKKEDKSKEDRPKKEGSGP